MRAALALVVLLLPTFALAESTSAVAARLRAEASRQRSFVASTSATTTGVVGSSPRVLASSGYTTAGRPACGSRGVLLDSVARPMTSCSNNSSWRAWNGCARSTGCNNIGWSNRGWSGGGCSTTRTCGRSDGVVVIAPTVIVIGDGGCAGSWGATSCTTRSTSTWGWGGSNCSRPADIRVSWQSTGCGH